MNTSFNFSDQENNDIDILKEIKYYIFFWPWFLASVIIFSVGSFLYLRYSDTIFRTSATLQVKDASSDPSTFLSDGGGAMFNFNRVKIDNYISQIGSKPNFSAVSDSLDLKTKVIKVGNIKKTMKFGDEIPFKILFKTQQKFTAINDSLIGLKIEPNNGLVTFGDYSKKFDPLLPFENEYFKIIVDNTKIDEDLEFLISRNSDLEIIDYLSKLIKINASSDDGDNINILIEGPNKKSNETILNTLIHFAHKQQISNRQEVYALSINFINKRLISIKNEIDSLTLQTTGFKSDNLIFSPEDQTKLALDNISTIDQERFDLSTQKELAISLQRNLDDQEDFSLLPSDIGLASGNVNGLVVSYNDLVLKRKNLLAGATTVNPVVIQLSEDIIDLRTNILKSIKNYIAKLDTSLTEFKEFQNQTNSEVSKIPNLEATLNTFQRKFQIAEKLYLYLLERREEASISLEATLPNTQVINYASTDLNPVGPQKKLIFFGSLILGLLFPFGVLYILKSIDTKIHTREELKNLIPNLDILGEVPFIEDSQTVLDSRGIFAESSRIIRSNINFKFTNNKKSHVILSTSSIKGEGKTMTAFNIAASYVAAGKKVILIGADLRNPQLHNLVGIDRKSNRKGLSTLISDGSINFNLGYIEKVDVFNKKMDILLSGPIPPNPAELLGSESFLNLLDELKGNYDYIIIDSAPLLLVSDTIPLLKIVDLVLYTTRAHYTDKKLASFINSLIEDKKVKNIGIILNGIKAGAKSYYKYGYSYRYSYQYKYNYGYGYGYQEDKS